MECEEPDCGVLPHIILSRMSKKAPVVPTKASQRLSAGTAIDVAKVDAESALAPNLFGLISLSFTRFILKDRARSSQKKLSYRNYLQKFFVTSYALVFSPTL